MDDNPFLVEKQNAQGNLCMAIRLVLAFVPLIADPQGASSLHSIQPLHNSMYLLAYSDKTKLKQHLFSG